MADVEVAIDGLGHRFGEQPFLFRDLTCTLRSDHVYALTGPSGAGKSTLLSLLAGWQTPSEGRISQRGVERIGWVFQNPHGVAGRTALDHVVLPYLVRGLSRSTAELEAMNRLREFGLAAHASSPFRDLSGGEAQRLMLARGMAALPNLFLVDEPTAQLDQHTAEKLNDTLHSMRAASTIVVIATHDPRTRDRCTDLIDLGAHR